MKPDLELKIMTKNKKKEKGIQNQISFTLFFNSKCNHLTNNTHLSKKYVKTAQNF